MNTKKQTRRAMLGGMTVFDEKGELAKLSAPLTDEKPGKLPYAIDYKVKLPK